MAFPKQRITSMEVEKYLDGVDYPASKEALLQCVKRNDAPEEIQETIDQLPEREYADHVDVDNAIDGGIFGPME